VLYEERRLNVNSVRPDINNASSDVEKELFYGVQKMSSLLLKKESLTSNKLEVFIEAFLQH